MTKSEFVVLCLPPSRLCACPQQWPVASCDSPEELEEAAQLQQELQSQFELLSAILSRRTAGLRGGKLPDRLSPRGVECVAANRMEPQGDRENNPARDSVQQCAITFQMKHAFSTAVLEGLQSSHSVPPYRTGSIVQDSVGRVPTTASRWPCCGSRRAHAAEPEESHSAAFPQEGVKITSEESDAAGAGQCGAPCGEVSPLRYGACQHQEDGAVAEREFRSSQISTSFTSLALLPSEAGSSRAQNTERRGSAAGGFSEHPRQSCLSRLCSVRRTATPHRKPHAHTADGSEGRIPVADVVTFSAGALSRDVPVATFDHEFAQGPCTHFSTVHTPCQGFANPQKPLRAPRGSQWGAAETILQQYHSASGSPAFQLQQNPYASWQQQTVPLYVNVVDPQVPQQLLQRQWRGQWHQWHSCTQQLPLQQVAMQQLALKQLRERGAHCSQVARTASSCVQTPWGTLVAPTWQAWAPWTSSNPAEELFAGQQGTRLPRVKRSHPSRSGPVPVVRRRSYHDMFCLMT